MRIVFIIVVSIICLFEISYKNMQDLDSLLIARNESRTNTSLIDIYLQIGDIYQKSYPNTALLYYYHAIDLCDSILLAITNNYEVLMQKATLLRHSGIVYFNNGLYDNSIDNFIEALHINEKIGDTIGISNSYLNIGIIYKCLGNYSKAFDYYLAALENFIRLENENGLSVCYVNIGQIFNEQGDFNKAIGYYLRALEIDEDMSNKKGISAGYINIGISYKNNENYVIALEYFFRALKIELKRKDGHRLANVYGEIASVYVNQYKSSNCLKKSNQLFLLDSAVYYGHNAYNQASVVGTMSIQNEAAKHLQQAYSLKGNYKEANKFAEIFITTQDSLFSNEKNNALIEMQINFEVEKQNQQIELQQIQLKAKDEKNEKQRIVRNILVHDKNIIH